MQSEHWKLIAGFEQYEISNFGRIRRISWVYNVHRSKNSVLKQSLDISNGYMKTVLAIAGTSKRSTVLIHRLVALAFLGEIPDGCEVNHKDGNKTNNTVSNLEYINRKSNLIHAVRLGKVRSGERSRLARLTEADVIKILSMLKGQSFSVGGHARSKVTLASIARQFGVSDTAVRQIYHGMTWKHLSVTPEIRSN